MGRNPFPAMMKTYPPKVKKNYYAIFFKEAPEESVIVDTWTKAQLAMRNRHHVLHHGFATKAEALAWTQETAKTAGSSGSVPASPKEAAVASYPERVATSRNARRILYYVDCAYHPQTKACNAGVWSPTIFHQQTINFRTGDPEKDKGKNHQFGELASIRAAFQHFIDNLSTYPDHTGLTVFTDSDYAEKTLNTWVADYKRRKDSSGRWLTARNTPVKHQDVIQEILDLRRKLVNEGKFSDVYFIPREMNTYADALSRGSRIAKHPVHEDKFLVV